MTRAQSLSRKEKAAALLALVAPGCALSGARFANPLALVFLLLPGLAVWLLWSRRQPALAFGAAGFLAKIKPGLVARLAWIPAALRVVAVLLLAVAVARPQVPAPELATREGIDIVVALDLSGSMGRALDGRRPRTENPPRLEVAKEVLRRDLLETRPNDRIGIVVFGAEAYTRAPLTLDHELLSRMVEDLRTDLFDQEFSSRTAIGDALGVAVNRLSASPEKAKRTKAIVLLTDGVSNAGVALPEDAAKAASEKGVRIYPVLIGQELGEEVDPEQLDRLAEATGTASDISAQGGKKHYAAPDREALRAGLHQILDSLDKATLQAAGKESFRELGPWLGGLALLLVLLEAALRLWRFRGLP